MISATISTDKQRLDVEIYNHGDTTKAIFDNLFAQKEAIEGGMGEKLEWQQLEEKKASRIRIFKTRRTPGR